MTVTAPPVSAPTAPQAPAPQAPAARRLTLRLSRGPFGGQLLSDRRAVTLFVRCSGVACATSVTGEVRLGARRLGTLSAPRGTLRLRAGKPGRAYLRSGRTLRARVRAALAAGRTPVIVLRVRALGDNGTTVTRTLKIDVRRLTRTP